MSLNKPTPRQLLRVSQEQLKAALNDIRTLQELVSSLQIQLSDRDQHIGSLQQITELLSLQLSDKDTVISELETRNMILEQANSGLSEKAQQQDAIIIDLQRQLLADRRKLARLTKEADKVGSTP